MLGDQVYNRLMTEEAKLKLKKNVKYILVI